MHLKRGPKHIHKGKLKMCLQHQVFRQSLRSACSCFDQVQLLRGIEVSHIFSGKEGWNMALSVLAAQ